MRSTCLAIVLIGSSIWAFDWYQDRWPLMTLNSEMAFILHYFLPNLVVSGVHCVKVVDQAITIDNLRLLCLVVNVCRGTARRPRYKYSIIARWKFCSRFINSRLSAQYLPSDRLDKKSYMSLRLVPNRWPWMTLNGEMALIMPYYTEFGNLRRVLRKSGWQSHNYMANLRLLCLVVNVCRGIARRPRHTYSITGRWKFCSRFINSRLNAQYLSSSSYPLIC